MVDDKEFPWHDLYSIFIVTMYSLWCIFENHDLGSYLILGQIQLLFFWWYSSPCYMLLGSAWIVFFLNIVWGPGILWHMQPLKVDLAAWGLFQRPPWHLHYYACPPAAPGPGGFITVLRLAARISKGQPLGLWGIACAPKWPGWHLD